MPMPKDIKLGKNFITKQQHLLSKVVKLGIARTEFGTSSTQIENSENRLNTPVNAIIMFIFVNYSRFDKPTSNTSCEAKSSRVGRELNSGALLKSSNS